jgi:hypothetical protein
MKLGNRRSPALRATLPGVVLILAILIAGALAPRANAAPNRTQGASARAADTPAPVNVTYHLQAQLVQGSSAGSSVAGQVSGQMDSTGVLTATLTITTGFTATVTGTFTGTGTIAPTHLVVKGNAGSMSLDGHAVSTAKGQWGGAIAQGGQTIAGSWILTPETQSISMDVGGASTKGSAHKVSLAGTLSLMATADGWADGTFTQLATGKVSIAEGRLLNGNLAATIHLPGKGEVLAVGSSRPFLQATKWSGSFVGPMKGDFGNWIAE